MKKEQVQKYIQGWEDVARIDAEHLRATPLHLKLQQVIALFQLGVGLGFTNQKNDKKSDHEITVIRARWSLLKAGY